MITLNYNNPKTFRSYQLSLIHDLLGDIVLTTFNSGSGSNAIGRRIDVQASLEVGLKHLVAEHTRRTRRGYQVVPFYK